MPAARYAKCSRIPKRSTIREFRNAAIPMNMAHSANMLGIRLGAVKYLGEDLLHHADVGHDGSEHHRHGQACRKSRCGCRAPAAPRRATCARVSVRRYSGCSVSGSRTKPHAPTSAAKDRKHHEDVAPGSDQQNQLPDARREIGTVRNTTKVSDMTRAICRPEYRSRITERVTVTQAAARPCTKRQASSAVKAAA